MIQQEHLTSYPNPEVSGGKLVTMPGMALDIRKAMQQHIRGTLTERAKGYYEAKGMVIPDFHKMDKVEKLLALNEFRKNVTAVTEQVQQAQARQALSNQKIQTNAGQQQGGV